MGVLWRGSGGGWGSLSARVREGGGWTGEGGGRVEAGRECVNGRSSAAVAAEVAKVVA